MPTSYAVSASPNPVSESIGTVTFTITRSGTLSAETVYLSTVHGAANGYATNSSDYSGIDSQGFSFSAGQASRTFTVSLINDGAVEADETFGFIVQRNASDPLGTFLAKTNWTIQDDDAVATSYAVSASPNPVSESNGTVTFTITRSGTLSAEMVYLSTVHGAANGYATNSSDYSGIDSQGFSFSAGQASRTFTVSLINDGAVEADETFGFIVQRNASDPLGTFLAKTNWTIQDDDAVATSYAVSASPNPVSESNGTVTFTITRSGTLSAETVYLSTVHGAANGYATNSSDYSGIDSQGFSFSAGQASRTFTVSLINDGAVEADETFGFIVQRNASDPLGTFLAKTNWTIQDDDAVATSYAVSASPNPVSESNGTVTFTITRSGTLSAETVYLSTVHGAANGYATNSSDYSGIDSQGFSFSAGQASRTFTVSLINDGAVETDETFGFIVQRNASDPLGTFLAKTNWTIQDDDAVATSYAVSASPNPVSESNGTVTFTITRSGTLSAETVYLSTVHGAANGYATNSSDYSGIDSQGFSFSAGQASRTFTVSLINDGAVEADETFGFIVQRNASDPLGTFLAKTNWTIQDDDAVATSYAVSASPNPVSESNGTVTFTITRSAGMPAETLFVSTVHGGANGYATNMDDYVGLANKTLSFAANELSKTISISLINSGAVEADETFGFIVQHNASDPLSTFLAKTNWTIQDDDDSAPALTVSLGPDITVNESDGYAVLTVSLDSPATQTASVFYSTFFGTASAGDGDYEGVIDQKVTFNPGEQTKQISVHLLNDIEAEVTEYFDVVLHDSEALVLNVASARIFIEDNDASNSLVVARGSLAFLSYLSQAAYHIPQPTITNPNGVDSTEQPSTLARYNDLLSVPGFQFLTASDLPELAPRTVQNTNFPTTGIIDGIFVNNNAAVLVGTIDDTLYIAFRGTNDANDIAGPDHLHWLNKQSHYDLFTDDSQNANFENAINDYITSHPDIKNVLVTGHSLGAAMAQEFYLRNKTLPHISAVTFASPGFDWPDDDVFDPKITNIIVAGDIIRTPEYASETFGLKFIVNDASFYTPFNGFELHDMSLYVAIAERLTEGNIDPRSRAIIDIGNGTDPHINLDINKENDNWIVKTPSNIDNSLIEGWNLFLATADDEIFTSGVYIASHLVSPITIDLAEGIARGVGAGVDRLIDIISAVSGAGDDLLIGNALNNFLEAGSGLDRVFGGFGFDWLKGGSGEGDDYYDGGPDTDTVDFSSTSLGITVDLSASGNHAFGPEIGVDQLISIENIVGGAGNDTITGDTGANLLQGAGGDDWLQGDGENTPITRVSVASDGTQANDGSPNHFNNADGPSLSADGRYIAFVSSASNLVSGDTNDLNDVFVYDRATQTTERVSIASDGSQIDGFSGFGADHPSISGDGQFVAFASVATNLVPGDANGSVSDIYVYDRLNETVERVSVSSSGVQGDNYSYDPVISADGQYVVFRSGATNLVSDDTNGVSDLFVCNRTTAETVRISIANDGTQANDDSFDPSISADGRYVAFWSGASNLVSGDTNGERDVFVYDLVAETIERVSVASNGAQSNGRSESSVISGDGRFVAFSSTASNLVPGINGASGQNIYVYDRQTGNIQCATIGLNGQSANSFSANPSLSFDGRYVVFQSLASNLVAGDNNGAMDVFVFDRLTQMTTMVSTAQNGAQGNGTLFYNSELPSISADGKTIAFAGDASNLVDGDTNNTFDIFAIEIPGNRNDTLKGGDGADILLGGGGDDRLLGDDGDDRLFAGFGEDRAEGGDGNDLIKAGPDNDTLIGGNGDDTLGASNRTDLLRGQGGHDLMLGSNGNDRLFGGGGNDTMLGGNGRDTLWGDEGGDRLVGGSQTDTASYANADSGVQVRLWNGDGVKGEAAGDVLIDIENLEGSGHGDSLAGDAGGNRIDGNFGDDILQGLGGADTLIGDRGDDTLTGGFGSDTFLYFAGDGEDVITDFIAGASSDDVIRFFNMGVNFDSFAEVLAAASDDGFGNTVIDFGGGDQITLQGVSVATLHQDDFAFS